MVDRAKDAFWLVPKAEVEEQILAPEPPGHSPRTWAHAKIKKTGTVSSKKYLKFTEKNLIFIQVVQYSS